MDRVYCAQQQRPLTALSFGGEFAQIKLDKICLLNLEMNWV